MPFVAESIWQALNEVAPHRGLPKPAAAAESVVIAPWPHWPANWSSGDIESRIGRMQELIRFVREVRNRYQVDAKTPLDVSVKCSAGIAEQLRALEPFIIQLAAVGKLEVGPTATKPAQKVSHVCADFEIFVSLVGLIDPAAETERLTKQLAEKRKFLQATQAKLANEGFVARAPAEVVQQQREQIEELISQIAAIEANIAELQN
jgi:valyl-tRNA synthetase